jgi:hypothetical protein
MIARFHVTDHLIRDYLVQENLGFARVISLYMLHALTYFVDRCECGV